MRGEKGGVKHLLDDNMETQEVPENRAVYEKEATRLLQYEVSTPLIRNRKRHVDKA